MIELNKIYNEDCLVTMQKISKHSVDCILTSPPYNTSRKGNHDLSKHWSRYESYDDAKTDEEYIEWTLRIFAGFDKILKPNGCVLYNMSYSSENSWLLWNLVSDIQRKTDFVIADCIIWKKQSALPNNTSPNKLTRICEHVFVFYRKGEFGSFFCNKDIASTNSRTGQTLYRNVFNFIEAPNNDENCPIHKATYSIKLCRYLLRLYCKEGGVVYDPFMGTGTTAIAAIREKALFVGSEISSRYTNWAAQRISVEMQQLTLF